MRTFLIWLVLAAILPLAAIAKDKTAAAKDKAAAEAVFHQVDKALTYWGNGLVSPVPTEVKIALQQLSGLVSVKGLKVVDYRLAYGKKAIYVKKTEITQIAAAKFRKFIEAEISANPESQASANDPLRWDLGIWAQNYMMSRGEKFQPQRKNISEWAWPAGTNISPKPKKPFINRVILVKENGQWKLAELQITAITDLLGD